jgi:hypothetical protein
VICAIVEATVGAVQIMLHNVKNTAAGGCEYVWKYTDHARKGDIASYKFFYKSVIYI